MARTAEWRYARIIPLLVCALALVQTAAGAPLPERERILTTVDLLRPLDPDAEDFEAAQSLVESDVTALFDELEREEPRREALEERFDRLERSLALLGEEAGYTSPYVQGVSGKRSLESYRGLVRHFAVLRQETLITPPPVPASAPQERPSPAPEQQPSVEQQPAVEDWMAPAPENASEAPTAPRPWWEELVIKAAILASRIS